MNYLAALDQLDSLGESLAKNFNLPGWRLHVRSRGSSQTSQIELQHWEGGKSGGVGYWYSCGNVAVSCGFAAGAIQLRTHITCTMCGKWSDERERAQGLVHLFKVAEAFESVTAGKNFDP